MSQIVCSGITIGDYSYFQVTVHNQNWTNGGSSAGGTQEPEVADITMVRRQLFDALPWVLYNETTVLEYWSGISYAIDSDASMKTLNFGLVQVQGGSSDLPPNVGLLRVSSTVNNGTACFRPMTDAFDTRLPVTLCRRMPAFSNVSRGWFIPYMRYSTSVTTFQQPQNGVLAAHSVIMLSRLACEDASCNTLSGVLSAPFNKRNDCTHGEDVGLMCGPLTVPRSEEEIDYVYTVAVDSAFESSGGIEGFKQRLQQALPTTLNRIDVVTVASFRFSNPQNSSLATKFELWTMMKNLNDFATQKFGLQIAKVVKVASRVSLTITHSQSASLQRGKIVSYLVNSSSPLSNWTGGSGFRNEIRVLLHQPQTIRVTQDTVILLSTQRTAAGTVLSIEFRLIWEFVLFDEFVRSGAVPGVIVLNSALNNATAPASSGGSSAVVIVVIIVIVIGVIVLGYKFRQRFILLCRGCSSDGKDENVCHRWDDDFAMVHEDVMPIDLGEVEMVQEFEEMKL